VRLIEHVLDGHPGLQVIGRTSDRDSLATRAGRLAPDVIIANTRLNGAKPDGVLADVTRSSPASILILLTHDPDERGEPSPRRACLPEDDVVRGLSPLIRKLVARARSLPPKPRHRADLP